MWTAAVPPLKYTTGTRTVPDFHSCLCERSLIPWMTSNARRLYELRKMEHDTTADMLYNTLLITKCPSYGLVTGYAAYDQCVFCLCSFEQFYPASFAGRVRHTFASRRQSGHCTMASYTWLRKVGWNAKSFIHLIDLLLSPQHELLTRYSYAVDVYGTVVVCHLSSVHPSVCLLPMSPMYCG